MTVSLVLDNLESFERLLEVFDPKKSYTKKTLGAGGAFAYSGEQSKYPKLIFVSGDRHNIRETLQFAQRTSSSEAFFCTGVETRFVGEYWIPGMCLRASGRLEFGGRPVLYEELEMNFSLLEKIRSRFPAQDLCVSPIFSCDRVIDKESDLEWLEANLSSPGADSLIAEVILSARSLQAHAVCVKMKNIENLVGSWKKFFLEASP